MKIDWSSIKWSLILTFFATHFNALLFCITFALTKNSWTNTKTSNKKISEQIIKYKTLQIWIIHRFPLDHWCFSSKVRLSCERLRAALMYIYAAEFYRSRIFVPNNYADLRIDFNVHMYCAHTIHSSSLQLNKCANVPIVNKEIVWVCSSTHWLCRRRCAHYTHSKHIHTGTLRVC